MYSRYKTKLEQHCKYSFFPMSLPIMIKELQCIAASRLMKVEKPLSQTLWMICNKIEFASEPESCMCVIVTAMYCTYRNNLVICRLAIKFTYETKHNQNLHHVTKLGLLKSSDLTGKNNGSVIRGTFFKNSIWSPLITALLTHCLKLELE